jgi:hypothetical protein
MTRCQKIGDVDGTSTRYYKSVSYAHTKYTCTHKILTHTTQKFSRCCFFIMTVGARTKRRYKAILSELMSSMDGVTYPKDQDFTVEELLRITPKSLVKYMCCKCFNQPEPPDTANPTEGRASSLEFYKKAISYFMPNRLLPWNEIHKEGNPTRSSQVGELIKRVKKTGKKTGKRDIGTASYWQG